MEKLIVLLSLVCAASASNAASFTYEEINPAPCRITIKGSTLTHINIPFAQAPNDQTCRKIAQQKFQELIASPKTNSDSREVIVFFQISDRYEEVQ